MTAILIQVRNRAKKGTLDDYKIDADTLHFFSGESQPYIALVMELGVLPPHLVDQEIKMNKGKETSLTKRPRWTRG